MYNAMNSLRCDKATAKKPIKNGEMKSFHPHYL